MQHCVIAVAILCIISLQNTPDEQKKMKSLFDTEEGKERDRARKRTETTVSQSETRAMIKQLIENDPSLSNVQVTKIVKEKLGKCSRNTVASVRNEMKK